MKSTGILRKIDELGRIVLPKELRNSFDINAGDAMEIYIEENTIVLKKHQPTCIFCGEEKNLREFKNHLVCKNCINCLK